MGRIVLDTTEAMSFEPTEPGPYNMTVDEVSDIEKGEKSRFIWVYFKFEDPNFDKKCGRVRRAYPIEGKGSGFIRELWKAAAGLEIPMGESGLEIDTDDIMGRRVLVQVANEEYEGRLQNTVERVSPAA